MPATLEAPTFLWLELTGRCQLACAHCYASSSPLGGHGTMAVDDWRTVLDDAAGQGVDMVQFIGGEPTLHPGFADLVGHALALGLRVEVYTNLLHVPARLWEVFALPGVRLATSYYSDDAGQHDAVTGRAGSHARTRANIVEAVRRGIPLRVGVIDRGGGQRVAEARTELEALGVTDIGVDHVRAFGRGASTVDESDTCGGCGHGAAAVGPDGAVTPCVFTRHAVAGNVRDRGLGAVLVGETFAAEVARLDAVRETTASAGCGPDVCPPKAKQACNPNQSQCKPKTPGK
jgi:MoaA/NifB/PqqE/SkfB family radical SAM enzyme